MRSRQSIITVFLALSFFAAFFVTVPVRADDYLDHGKLIEDIIHDHPTLYRMSRVDPRRFVRYAANDTLLAKPFEPAYREFLNGGLARAIEASRAEAEFHGDFIARVMRVYRPETSPRVHAGALLAQAGGPAARAEFVRAGFATALRADQEERDTKGEHKKAITEADRAFVRTLRQDAPGAHVRYEAARASLPEANDDDLTNFFTVTWFAAAAADVQDYSLAALEADIDWRRQVESAIENARSAEAAAHNAPASELEAEKSSAIRLWRQVGSLTEPPTGHWETTGKTSGQYVTHWSSVRAVAENRPGPNWRAASTTINEHQTRWAEEREMIDQHLAYWARIREQARIAEDRIKKITGNVIRKRV